MFKIIYFGFIDIEEWLFSEICCKWSYIWRLRVRIPRMRRIGGDSATLIASRECEGSGIDGDKKQNWRSRGNFKWTEQSLTLYTVQATPVQHRIWWNWNNVNIILFIFTFISSNPHEIKNLTKWANIIHLFNHINCTFDFIKTIRHIIFCMLNFHTR